MAVSEKALARAFGCPVLTRTNASAHEASINENSGTARLLPSRCTREGPNRSHRTALNGAEGRNHRASNWPPFPSPRCCRKSIPSRQGNYFLTDAHESSQAYRLESTGEKQRVIRPVQLAGGRRYLRFYLRLYGPPRVSAEFSQGYDPSFRRFRSSRDFPFQTCTRAWPDANSLSMQPYASFNVGAGQFTPTFRETSWIPTSQTPSPNWIDNRAGSFWNSSPASTCVNHAQSWGYNFAPSGSFGNWAPFPDNRAFNTFPMNNWSGFNGYPPQWGGPQMRFQGFGNG